MPKLPCKCGAVINLSLVPCPNEYFLISGGDMEVIFREIETTPSNAEDLLERMAISVIVCKVCGRHYISKGKESVEYIILAPESSAPVP